MRGGVGGGDCTEKKIGGGGGNSKSMEGEREYKKGNNMRLESISLS